MQAAWREVVGWAIEHPWGAAFTVAILAMGVEAGSPKILTVLFIGGLLASAFSYLIFRKPPPEPDCSVCGSALEAGSPRCTHCGHIAQALIP